jgi:septal ring factor EnvC (AmiA/AmiB activator)
MEMCILCKQNPAVGRTTRLYCEKCQEKDILVKMGALQRDTRFKEGFSVYQDECWKKEKVLKTNRELSRYLQEKCVSFSPEHFGFEELTRETIECNESIPKLIKAKVELRKRTKIELEEVNEKIKLLEKELEKTKVKKRIKEIESDLKKFKKDQKNLEEELKRLRKI